MNHSIDIRVFDTDVEMARALATAVAAAVHERPSLVLALPTGRTPLATYAELARLQKAGRVDFSCVTCFGLDEFVGVPPTSSFRRYLDRHFFSQVGITEDQVHTLDGNARDIEQECQRYDDDILRCGGLDSAVLGVGANGHIGFNEPSDALVADAHVVTLHESTRQANAYLFDGAVERVPREAVSMGMGTILRASRLVLAATGTDKAGCVERALHARVTPQFPASFLQLHRRVEVYLDRGAASLIRDPACIDRA